MPQPREAAEPRDPAWCPPLSPFPTSRRRCPPTAPAAPACAPAAAAAAARRSRPREGGLIPPLLILGVREAEAQLAFLMPGCVWGDVGWVLLQQENR